MTPSEIFFTLFDVGKDILASALDKATSVILCQVGNATDDTPDTDAAELWGPPGYYGIPAAPTKGKPSCQCVTLRQSDHDMILATRDTRDSSIYGALQAGERCIAGGYPNQNRVLLKNDGSITIYTAQGNAAGGASIAMQMNADGSINLASPLGAISLASDALRLMFGTSSGIQCDANGVTAIGTGLGVNAGSVALGASPADGVVLQTLLMAQLTALATWCSSVSAVVASLLTSSGVTAPEQAAVAAAQTALTAALAVPNYSTSVKAAK